MYSRLLLNWLRDKPFLSEMPLALMTAEMQACEVADFESVRARNMIAKPFVPIQLAHQLRTLRENGIVRR